MPVRDAAPVPGRPPGQMLPVVEPPSGPGRHAGANGADREHGAAGVVAVPVRQQPEPGQRTDARLEAGAGGRPAAEALVLTEEGDFWHVTVQQLIASEAVAALVRELALQSQLVARDTDVWMLRVERESLNQPTSRERLQNALHAAGHVVSLTVEVGRVADSPARRNAAAAAEKQRAAEETILNDSWVQELMRTHQARMLPAAPR